MTTVTETATTLFDTIYGLNLTGADGEFSVDKKSAAGGVGGSSSYWPASLGGHTVDAWKKDKAPSPRELIHELIGVAFACVCLRADSIAAAPLRLYSVSRKGRRKPKYFEAYEYRTGHCVPTEPVPAKQLAHLRSMPHLRRKLTATASPGIATNPHVAGNESTVEEVTKHPALDLMHSPENIENDYGLSGYDHAWMTQLFLDSLGRAYWFVEKDGLGKPKNLWLLRSHFVKEVPDFSGKKLIDYFEYGGQTGMRYQPDEIVKFHCPDPYSHHYNGYGRLQAAIEKLRLLRRGDAQINAILENSGLPGLIVSPKPNEDGGAFMSPVEARKLQVALNQWLRQAGAGGTTVMPYPMDMMFPQWRPAEIIDKERYKQIKTDILNVFGIPESMFDMNDANLTSAGAGEYHYAKRAQLPAQTRIEASLNSQYLPQFGDAAEGFFFAFDNPVPEDKAFELERSTTGWEAGVLEVDEFRVATGHKPYGDQRGKRRFISTAVTTLDEKTGLPMAGPGASSADASLAPETPSAPAPKKKPKKKPKKTGKILSRLTDAVELLAHVHQRSGSAEVRVVSPVSAEGNSAAGEILPDLRDAVCPPEHRGTAGSDAAPRRFRTIEEAQHFLDEKHDGHGRIENESGKVLSQCRCGGGETVTVEQRATDDATTRLKSAGYTDAEIEAHRQAEQQTAHEPADL